MVRSGDANGHPSGARPVAEELLEDFVNESHIQAFAEALQADDFSVENHDLLSPVPGSNQNGLAPHGQRIRKVSALSDFAPINLRVKRKRRRDRVPERKEWMFLLLRWPLLLFIFIFIMAEFGLYVLIRQLVNAKEWLSAWRGRKGILRQEMRGARTYEEWKAAARKMDEYLGFDSWKKVDEDTYYDWRLVRKVKRSLKTLRGKNDVRAVLGVLETCLRANFAGVESARLYSETFLGTKDLIESYYDELEKALEYIRESSMLSIEEKKRFFRSANTNFGQSALCLSGGASFGYYHFGVIKAFFDSGLLPRVITGTSAGGLIAALTCTRTDAELKRLLVPELANRITACEEPFSAWFQRSLKTGARFDSVQWARKSTFFTRGSMTFREAYLRTGRILNISVIPADRHSPTKLLNYMTAPDTVIWSALLASAAVPGILNPVVLMQKLRDGRIVPWNWGSRFKDGSLRVDIPVQALNLYFNVTNPIVSQVNPHVHLFFFAPRGSAGKPVATRKGKGWRGNFLLSAAEQWLKLELTKNFKVIRDLELLPELLGQDWSSVFLQRFEGAVTIWPRTRLMDWVHILSDPDPQELERMMIVGQGVTWPKLHMIGNRHRLEKQILHGRQAVRKALNQRGRIVSANGVTSLTLQIPDSSVKSNIPETIVTSPEGTEVPISADTDAETAFVNGSRWFFQRGRRTDSPSDSAPKEPEEGSNPNSEDPLRLPQIRRKWTSGLLEELNANVSDTASPHDAATSSASPVIPFPTQKARNHSHHDKDTFLSRLRQQTIPLLTPFGLGPQFPAKNGHARKETGGEVWSSDTSSEDHDEISLEQWRRLRHPSVFKYLDPVDDDDGKDDHY